MYVRKSPTEKDRGIASDWGMVESVSVISALEFANYPCTNHVPMKRPVGVEMVAQSMMAVNQLG
jgi:hypothetical protein